ncbi:hypothetical protein L9F63_016111 [Diploptera punctata]|uniref:DDE Tnp4 domain-containing protein n=1 Tax=Diploptera punctata TaxID=6984 RepID=A0AAD7ZSN9_DIPPU|nr:hypothetical protein L9F63_020175 [Diploptera punctata]KAJ9590867.1 hypothetical protein L9F63_016111 [Diploptera punctata]
MDCTHIRIRSPGGDDAERFRNRKGYFSLNVQGLYGDSVLLVDAGYPCRSYLMPPLVAPASNVVERLFGSWKRRFPVLAVGINVKLDNAFPIIVATAVLHNILRRAGEELPQDDPNLNLVAPWNALLEEGNVNPQVNNDFYGVNAAVRQRLINQYFHSLIE